MTFRVCRCSNGATQVLVDLRFATQRHVAMDSLSNRVAIPFPSPLVGINPGAAPPTLNITTSPAVANALLLAGHPFLFRRKTLASSSCLTLSHIEAELTGPIVGARYSCSSRRAYSRGLPRGHALHHRVWSVSFRFQLYRPSICCRIRR